MPSTSVWLTLNPRRWLRRIGNQLLPGSCALCGGRVDGVICAACHTHHLADRRARCRCCGIGLVSAQPLCGRCLSQPPAFDGSCAATSYQAPVDLLVQQLKFGARLPLASAFAAQMLDRLRAEQRDGFDLVLPVPLSAERLAERGFNQALEIARPLARALRLPLRSDLCMRVRDTAPQATLALADRQGNMRGAFAVLDREAVRGRHLLVVDDVMTTGHTLDALAACLKRNGAARVTNCVFARTPLT